MARDVKIAIVGDASQLKRAMAAAEQSVGGFDRAMSSVSKSTVALGAAMGGALLATANQVMDMAVRGLTWLPKLGAEFDAISDKARIMAGDNYLALTALNTSFEKLLPNVASSMEDVGNVLDVLYSRLRMTGAPAEALAEQILNLSRITGSDLDANLAAITQALSLWNVAAEDAPGIIDQILRAFQETGTPVTKIAEDLGASSIQLQLLGFSIEDVISAAAGLGKVDLSVGDLNKSLNRLIAAHPGEDLAGIFDAFIAGVQNGSITLEDAIAELGTKGGASFYRLAQLGKLSFADIQAAIQSNTDTVNGAAAATDDWPERWQKSWNAIQLALKPFAKDVFDTIDQIMSVLIVKDEQGNIVGLNIAGAWDIISQKWDTAWPQIKAVLERLWANFSAWWNDPKTQQVMRDIGSNLGTVLADAFKASIAANFKDWGLKSLLTAMGFGWAVALFDLMGLGDSGPSAEGDIGGPAPTPDYLTAPPNYLARPKPIFERAAGGPTNAGWPYWVGERGPELFVPATSGRIIPNGSAAAGDTNHFNIYGSADPRQTAWEIIRARRAQTFLAGAA